MGYFFTLGKWFCARGVCGLPYYLSFILDYEPYYFYGYLYNSMDQKCSLETIMYIYNLA